MKTYAAIRRISSGAKWARHGPKRPTSCDTQPNYSIGRRSYYRKTIGNCDFFFLDTRSHREMHDTRQPDKKGLSILGMQQKQRLLEGLSKSEADFLFVVSSVNFMVPHVGGSKVRATNKDDAWTVFFDEREQLIAHFDQLNKPVLVLTGDLHNSFVINNPKQLDGKRLVAFPRPQVIFQYFDGRTGALRYAEAIQSVR